MSGEPRDFRTARGEAGGEPRRASPGGTGHDARPYATENGFYLGDSVRTPDGRRGCIDEIVVQRCSFLTSFGVYVGSVVRLDDEFWMDGALTRVR